MRHLEDPAGLIHRIGMDEGDDGAFASHLFIVKRSVNVIGHGVSFLFIYIKP